MPLPALHCRAEQGSAKTETAPELSLRGPNGAVAISGRHSQFAQAADKNVPTDCVCSGAQRAPWRLASYRVTSSIAPVLVGGGVLDAPPRKATVFAGAFLLSNHVPRDCTPRALPRAARSGRHVGLWPPRNDKPLAFTVLSPACSYQQHCAGPGCPLPYILHICKKPRAGHWPALVLCSVTASRSA